MKWRLFFRFRFFGGFFFSLGFVFGRSFFRDRSGSGIFNRRSDVEDVEEGHHSGESDGSDGSKEVVPLDPAILAAGLHAIIHEVEDGRGEGEDGIAAEDEGRHGAKNGDAFDLREGNAR